MKAGPSLCRACGKHPTPTLLKLLSFLTGQTLVLSKASIETRAPRPDQTTFNVLPSCGQFSDVPRGLEDPATPHGFCPAVG